MEFKVYNNRTDYVDYRSLTSASGLTEASSANQIRHEGYDQVTIHSDFARLMAQKAGSGEECGSVDRILALRQQIASGTYQTDSRRIAECMLERRSMPGIFS